MAIIHNKRPIIQSFDIWINNYPESFHPLDMQRFYTFVKAVCRYSRTPKDQDWLREKIKKSKNSMTEADIEVYCEKFKELQTFYKARMLQVYDLDI